MEKAVCDITIPMTRPVYSRNYKRLSDLDPLSLDPVYDQEELEQEISIKLKMEFATTETEVHQADIGAGTPPLAQEIISSITNKVIRTAKLTGVFNDLYPIVSKYLKNRCFGRKIDVDSDAVRSRLRDIILQEGIAKYMARKIGALTAEIKQIEFESKELKLSKTSPFTWRRNLPLLSCGKTIFNLVATYNDFEKDFARFLENADDILRFSALGTTEQESGTAFRVDYLKPSGATGFYYPDWVAIQKKEKLEVNWIIETKGRVWEDTKAKDRAISLWCQKVTEQTGKTWRYLRVNQTEFGVGAWGSLSDMLNQLSG